MEELSAEERAKILEVLGSLSDAEQNQLHALEAELLQWYPHKKLIEQLKDAFLARVSGKVRLLFR